MTLGSNARDQRRRAIGTVLVLLASDMATSAGRCIAWLAYQDETYIAQCTALE